MLSLEENTRLANEVRDTSSNHFILKEYYDNGLINQFQYKVFYLKIENGTDIFDLLMNSGVDFSLYREILGIY